MTPPPPVTVLCATRDSADSVRLTFESFARCTPEPVRVLVADNGSVDGTLEYLQGLPWIELHPLSQRTAGASADAVAAAEHCPSLDYLASLVRTEYFLTLDSDVELLEPGWLSQLLEMADRDGLAALGELQPQRGTVMARLAPHMLLIRTRVFREQGLSFAAYTRIEDPAEVERFDALSLPTHFRLSSAQAQSFRTARFYMAGAALFERLQATGAPWADIPAATRAAYRHYGHMSWAARDPDMQAAHAERAALIRTRLQAYAGVAERG